MSAQPSKSETVERHAEIESLEKHLVQVIQRILERPDMAHSSVDLIDGYNRKEHTPPPAGKKLVNGRKGLVTAVAYSQSIDEKIANCKELSNTIQVLLSQIPVQAVYLDPVHTP